MKQSETRVSADQVTEEVSAPPMGLLAGWIVRKIPAGRPRLERERGSGYVNLAAIERNRHRLNVARKVYTMPGERMIIVPSWYFDEFIAAIRKAERHGTGPRRLTDEEIDRLYERLCHVNKADTDVYKALSEEIFRVEEQRKKEMEPYLAALSNELDQGGAHLGKLTVQP